MRFSLLLSVLYILTINSVLASGIDNSSGHLKTNLNNLSCDSGTWIVQQAGLYSNLEGKGDGFLLSTTSVENYVYEAKVVFHNTGESAASLVFGSNNALDMKNMYVANVNPHSGLVRLFKFQHNTRETESFDLVSPRNVALSSDSSYHLRVTVIGNHIVFEVNGDVVANTADYLSNNIGGQNTAFVGKNLGLLTYNAVCTYQDVYYTELDDTTTPQLKSIRINALSGEVNHNIQFDPNQYLYIAHVNIDCRRVNLEFEISNETTVVELKQDNNFYSNTSLRLNPGVNYFTLVSKNNQAQVLYQLIIIKENQSVYYNEPQRGQYHYSVKQGWANDPNGMVYFNGEYHLFHQYYYGLSWGYMHWAHAVSKDLIHWEELPVTFYPDEYGTMFSGCAIADENNTSGLFVDENGEVALTGGIVALITADGNGERVIAAYSADGRNWKKHHQVLIDWTDDPLYERAFRDPKVFRYQNKWFMVIAGGPLRIYSSDNLLDWQVESTYPDLHTECPDLVRLPVVKNGLIVEYKWLLSRSGRFYKVGDFVNREGKWQFIPESDYLYFDKIMNFGKDAYAMQTYYNGEYGENQNRVIGIQWMNNFDYFSHDKQPFGNNTYNGSFTVQFEMSLQKNNAGRYLLMQKPILEYESLRNNEINIVEQNKMINDTSYQYNLSSKSYEIEAEFTIDEATNVGFKINTGDEKYIVVGYNVSKNLYYIDRRYAGIGSDKYTVYSSTSGLFSSEGKVMLNIFVDRNSVELFADDYTATGTALIAPSESLEIFVTGNSTANVNIYPLKSIWDDQNTTDIVNIPLQSETYKVEKIGKNNYYLEGKYKGFVQIFNISGSLLKSIQINEINRFVNLSDISNNLNGFVLMKLYTYEIEKTKLFKIFIQT
jgi:fructan beta-fructosidase